MKITYCLNTQTLFRASLTNKIRAAARAGFSSIELWFDEVDNFVREGGSLAQLRKLISDSKLTCASINRLEGWFDHDGTPMGCSSDHDKIFDECRRRMEIAVALRAKCIVAIPESASRPRPADFDLGIANYMELVELGKEIGIPPSLTFVAQAPQIHNLPTALHFLRLTGATKTPLAIDLYQVWRGDNSVESIANLRPSQVALFQVSDADPRVPRSIHRDRERLMPGDGSINFIRFFEILASTRYSGVVSLSVANRKIAERDANEVCSEGYQKLKKLWESAVEMSTIRITQESYRQATV